MKPHEEVIREHVAQWLGKADVESTIFRLPLPSEYQN